MKKILILLGGALVLNTTHFNLAIAEKSLPETLIAGRDDCSKCEKAAEEAYKYAQQADDAGNFEGIRKNAGEAMEAFEEAEKFADKCGCEKAEDEARKGYKIAKKAIKAENLKDAQELAKDARRSADDLRSYARKCSRD